MESSLGINSNKDNASGLFYCTKTNFWRNLGEGRRILSEVKKSFKIIQLNIPECKSQKIFQ